MSRRTCDRGADLCGGCGPRLPSTRITMPSADFSDAVGSPCEETSPPRADTPETSRGKFDRLRRTPAESTPAALDGYGLRGQAPARPATNASIRFLYIRSRLLLPASFRPRLAATPLRFARTSPPSGCAGDLHPSVVEHARHTPEAPPSSAKGRLKRPEMRVIPIVAHDQRSVVVLIGAGFGCNPTKQPGCGSRAFREGKRFRGPAPRALIGIVHGPTICR